MNQNRKQVRDLGNPQLRSAPLPSDTYVAPARPQVDRSMEDLAGALGFFNQNLGRLAQGMAANREAMKQQEAQRQETTLNLSTEEQRAEIVRTGMIEGQPLANVQLKKMAGSATGADWEREMDAYLATQDLTEMDIEAFVHERAAEALGNINGDDAVLNGFAGHVRRVISRAERRRDELSLQERQDFARRTTFAFLQGEVRTMIEDGTEPAAVHERVRAFYRDVGAGGSRILSEETLDSHVVALASQIVGDHPEYAMALIGMDRTGTEGEDLGPLSASPSFTAQAAGITAQGERAILQRETRAAMAERREADFRRVIVEGDYSAFGDYTVNGKTISGAQRATEFMADLNARLDAGIADGTVTEQGKREEVAEWAAKMNLDDPFVKQELAGMERRYSTIDALNDPEQLADVEERVSSSSTMRAGTATRCSPRSRRRPWTSSTPSTSTSGSWTPALPVPWSSPIGS